MVVYANTDMRQCPNAGREHRSSTLYVQVHSTTGYMRLRCRCSKSPDTKKKPPCTEWRSPPMPICLALSASMASLWQSLAKK